MRVNAFFHPIYRRIPPGRLTSCFNVLSALYLIRNKAMSDMNANELHSANEKTCLDFIK